MATNTHDWIRSIKKEYGTTFRLGCFIEHKDKLVKVPCSELNDFKKTLEELGYGVPGFDVTEYVWCDNEPCWWSWKAAVNAYNASHGRGKNDN